MKPRHAGLPLAILTLAATFAVLADEPDVQVARVSYTGGDVSYQRGDSDGWNALGVNTPIVTGDSVYTADDGRAEVYLGNGNVLRMDTGTQVDLVSNTRDLAQLGLRSGYLSLRARGGSENGGLEIDTPNGAATVEGPGIYRVEMTKDTARYSVVKGRLSVALAGQQLDVDAGETLTIEGSDQPKYSFGPIAPQSAFDSWAHDRDNRADRAASARYVHRDVVGAEDLDGNGTWRESSEYGRVWVPSGVSAGWAPYQAGSWTWQDPYGWTWVSSEPWGWAPYHYGRWVSIQGTWGWVPPPPAGAPCPAVVADLRPVYAPALVAFVGGRNWSVGVSIGGAPSIGWVPLAPAERYYYPWQPAPHVTNNYTYTNITVNNAVTVVNTTNFSGGPVRPIHVPPGQLKHAPPMGCVATEIVPTHDSITPFHQRDPHSRYVPQHDVDRPLIVRNAPPPRPVPFREKVVEIQKTGRPFDAHDRGQHNGWSDRGDKNDRMTTVSALAPQGRRSLTPREGAPAKAPKAIDRAAVPPRQTADPYANEHANQSAHTAPPYANEHAAQNARTEPTHGSRDHRPSDADRPEHAEVSAVPPSSDRNGHGSWKDDHHTAPPAQGNRAHAPASEPAVAMTPVGDSERHGQPAESMHDSHASASQSHAPAPEAPPSAQENHSAPQHNGAKQEPPKAKDQKGAEKDKNGKGKEKEKHDGQS
ncbi:MAG TPA: DUF6600 domain-containing protein [Candidatus Polarisedimenticolaceae bacterium]|nr:DUF6600 domain-containing protein [Candidatus Polarisedimenticolaceae bacterium]